MLLFRRKRNNVLLLTILLRQLFLDKSASSEISRREKEWTFPDTAATTHMYAFNEP